MRVRLMGPSAVLLGRHAVRRTSAVRAMGACASSLQCHSGRFREPCQWQGRNTPNPCCVSVWLHPLQGGSAPVLWHDWSRWQHRRACMQLRRHQRGACSIRSGHLCTGVFSCPARPRSALVGRASGTDGLCLTDWSEDHHAVWGPRRMCDLAGSVDGVTPRSVASGFSLLGKADVCEWSLILSFPPCLSFPLLFALSSSALLLSSGWTPT